MAIGLHVRLRGLGRPVAWRPESRIFPVMAVRFDPKERAREKQRSRDEDARALASGEKSREELRRENGHVVFPNVRISLSGFKPLE